MRIISWIGDIYKTQGYVAALVTIVVLVALALGVSMVNLPYLAAGAYYIQSRKAGYTFSVDTETVSA